MSIRDARTLLEDATYLFFFLPAVNYMYIFIYIQNNGFLADEIMRVLVVVAITGSAFVYNYNAGQPDDSATFIKLLYLIFIILLSIFLVHSMAILFEYLSQESIGANVLFFLSSIATSLIVTHNFIDFFADGYTNSI